MKRANSRWVYLGIRGIDVQAVRRQHGIELAVEDGVYVFEAGNNTPVGKAG